MNLRMLLKVSIWLEHAANCGAEGRQAFLASDFGAARRVSSTPASACSLTPQFHAQSFGIAYSVKDNFQQMSDVYQNLCWLPGHSTVFIFVDHHDH